VETVVELEGVNGEWFTLAGPNAGDRGVYLSTDVKGLYDPPVKVVYEEPGNYPGARYLSHRILRRDITFKVDILNDKGSTNSWISRDSEWRKAWAFDRDSYLHVTTDESGTRTLKCRLGESPDISLYTDPHGNTMNDAIMTIIAGDPFWYEEDVVYSVKTKRDTRFSPSLFDVPGEWPWEQLPTETLHIHVDPSDNRGGLNPTDQYVWVKYGLPASTSQIPQFPWPFPPGIAIPWERAPFTQFILPDRKWEEDEEGPADPNRRVKTPGLIIGEDCVLDTDPREEQFTSASGSPVWARTNGVRWRYAVPPYTRDFDFQIDVSGCAPGQMITLRIPRPWSRPWGLE
jgi:hypothetical protein